MYSMCNLTLRIHADQRQAGRAGGPTRAATVTHGSSRAPTFGPHRETRMIGGNLNVADETACRG